MGKNEENIADHEARLKNLEDYQDIQNGRLGKIEDRIDKIYYILITLLLTMFGNLWAIFSTVGG